MFLSLKAGTRIKFWTTVLLFNTILLTTDLQSPTSLLQQMIPACEGESIHKAPQIINKRSREYALNSNSTVNKLSDFASSKQWTASSGIFVHNSSDLDFGFNQSFTESNNISKLTGFKGWTSSSGFFAYKNSNMLSRIQPRNYYLSKYRHSVTSLRGRVLLLTSPSFFALYNCNLHPADHRAPSITGDHLVELPAIFDNSDEISNQNQNKLSKIQEQNYSLPSRHSIMCLRGRVHALCSSLTFKVLLLKCPSTKRINQRSNPSSRSNLSVLQMKNDIILQLYSVSESFNIKRSTLQRSATNMISLFLIPEHEITTKLFLTNDLQSNKCSKSPAFQLIVKSCLWSRKRFQKCKSDCNLFNVFPTIPTTTSIAYHFVWAWSSNHGNGTNFISGFVKSKTSINPANCQLEYCNPIDCWV